MIIASQRPLPSTRYSFATCDRLLLAFRVYLTIKWSHLSSVYQIHPGETIHLITTAADNLIQGNAHDPTPNAAALAVSASPTAIAEASDQFWRGYWNASSVDLPTRPALENAWYGSQYLLRGIHVINRPKLICGS